MIEIVIPACSSDQSVPPILVCVRAIASVVNAGGGKHLIEVHVDESETP